MYLPFVVSVCDRPQLLGLIRNGVFGHLNFDFVPFWAVKMLLPVYFILILFFIIIVFILRIIIIIISTTASVASTSFAVAAASAQQALAPAHAADAGRPAAGETMLSKQMESPWQFFKNFENLVIFPGHFGPRGGWKRIFFEKSLPTRGS